MSTRRRFLWLLCTLLIVQQTLWATVRSEAGTPSNASSAFLQLPLGSPNGGTGYVIGGHTTWPTFLDSIRIRGIGGTDSIQIQSTRSAGVSVGLNGLATYTFPPRTFANRVGAIVTANDWSDGSDTGFPVLTASFTFADGRTWGSGTLYDVSSGEGYSFRLSHRVRNWSDQVVPGDAYFVAPPPNPAVFQLCAQASNGGVGNVFSDVQTFNIPDTLRSTALRTVTFASHTTAFDSTHITSATALVSGFVVWPQFQIANRSSAPLALQKQDDAAWGGLPYGGYYHNGSPVRPDSTIAFNGCLLTSISMIHEYFGIVCDPDTLNRFLQWHRGYLAYPGVAVDSVVSTSVGSTVGFRWLSTPQSAGTRYVVEREASAWVPLGTISVLNTAGRRGRAEIVQTFGSWPADSVYQGIIRNLINPLFASGPFTASTPADYQWEVSGGSFKSVVRDSVEQALCDSLPVLLQVDNFAHWVVATGRRPTWETPTLPRGTYSVADPLYSTNTLFAGHANTYLDAMRVARGPNHQVPGPHLLSGDPPPACAVLVSGPAHVYLEAPDGGSIRFDAATDSYASTIAGAVALRRFATADVGTSAPCDMIVMPEAADGDYDLVVHADAAGLAGVRTETIGLAGVPTAASAAVDLPTATQARFVLHHTGYDVSLQHQGGTTDVQAAQSARLSVGVRPNPLVRGGTVSWSVDRNAEGSVALFDVTGRRVRTLYAGKMGAGRQQVSLEGASAEANRLHPGLYFIRVTAGSRTGIAKFVVLGSE